VIAASFTSRWFPSESDEFADEGPDRALALRVQEQTAIVRFSEVFFVGHARRERDRARGHGRVTMHEEKRIMDE
jgi:hypothetical protein